MNLDSRIKSLYLKGQSAPDIALKLNISLKRIYYSLKKQGIARRSTAEQNRIRFNKSPLSYHFKDKLKPREQELLIAAIMLYYGEGAKNGHTVDLANSDPRAHLLFLNFLRQICRIDESRLRFYLYSFADQNTKSLIKFWSRCLGVKVSSFTKPYVRRGSSSKMSRVMPYGVLHIRYSDKRLLGKILSLIDETVVRFN